MKTIALFSALALGALTSAALAEPATPITTASSQQAGRVELSDTQLDKLKAGSNGSSNDLYHYNNGPKCTSGYAGRSNTYQSFNSC